MENKFGNMSAADALAQLHEMAAYESNKRELEKIEKLSSEKNVPNANALDETAEALLNKMLECSNDHTEMEP